MSISEGDPLPEATLIRLGDDGPEGVALHDLAGSGRAVIFAVPGAYTGVCTTAHVPSFIRTKEDFAAKGIDTVICVSVNDPFVMAAWGESTGAAAAGIHMLADPEATFTKSMGMSFNAPPAGLIDRSQRYAMVVDDGKVVTLQAEESPGTCDVSGGEALLATL